MITIWSWSIAILFWIGIELRVILKKRPLIVSNKILNTVMMGAMTLAPFLYIVIMIGTNKNKLYALMMMVLFLVIIFASRQKFNGYTIVGIDNSSLRKSIVSVLNKLNMRFNEGITGITIPGQAGQDIGLTANVQTGGVAIIRMNDPSHQEWLKKLAAGLKDYYAETPVKVNMTPRVISCVAWLFLLLYVIKVYCVIRN